MRIRLKMSFKQQIKKLLIFLFSLFLMKWRNPFRYKTELLQKQPNTKVILIDTEKNFDNLQKSIRCGAIDYLVSPLDEKELQQSIHRSILSLNQISLLHYPTTPITDNRSEQINQIIQYIHLNFKDEISLDTLANFSHMHRNYVSRLFKETTGMSFTEYLTFYRIEQGKKFLVSTDNSIALIAEDVGYGDPAYFSRIFKKKLAIHQINIANISPHLMCQQILTSLLIKYTKSYDISKS